MCCVSAVSCLWRTAPDISSASFVAAMLLGNLTCRGDFPLCLSLASTHSPTSNSLRTELQKMAKSSCMPVLNVPFNQKHFPLKMQTATLHCNLCTILQVHTIFPPILAEPNTIPQPACKGASCTQSCKLHTISPTQGC